MLYYTLDSEFVDALMSYSVDIAYCLLVSSMENQDIKPLGVEKLGNVSVLEMLVFTGHILNPLRSPACCHHLFLSCSE